VLDDGRETAYASAVLGRLQRGFRVFQLRSLLGTRIELCYLFVHINLGSCENNWPSARQLRERGTRSDEIILKLREELAQARGAPQRSSAPMAPNIAEGGETESKPAE